MSAWITKIQLAFFAGFVVCILVEGPLFGGIVSIIACDTVADSIGESVARDMSHVQNEIRQIALYTNSSLQELIFDGASLYPQAFLDTLRALEFTEEDTIIFYFSGHGYRTFSKDEGVSWPNFYFTISDKGVDYAQIIEILSSKNQNLLIAIADCCNNFLEASEAPPLVKRKIEALSSGAKSNYKKLFLETSGKIIITSSDIGELSWCYTRGAIFTMALFDCIQEETRKKKTSWSMILDLTAVKVSAYQTPVYVIQ